MKHLIGISLFMVAVGLLFFALASYYYEKGFESQKVQIERAFIAPSNLSIDTILGKNLPTEKILDDESLLGIDTNHNEIRDDIELKVFETFKSPIKRALLLQIFRTEQRMLMDPNLIKNARYWAIADSKYGGCDRYLHLFENIEVIRGKDIDMVLDWQYNNAKRIKTYRNYDRALSGGVYSIPKESLQACEFDVEAVLQLEKEAKDKSENYKGVE